MLGITPQTNGDNSSTLIAKRSALSAFHFENGYTFSATDLGNQGVTSTKTAGPLYCLLPRRRNMPSGFCEL
jgi:hypothetical protein